MKNCTKQLFQYQSFDRRKIEASFTGGDISSDGGMMSVGQADHLIGLTSLLNQAMKDPRNPTLITHDQQALLRQRIYRLTLGYEDLNDHNTLRKDLAWQTAIDRDEELASSPTLCRLESRADRGTAVEMSKVFFGEVYLFF